MLVGPLNRENGSLIIVHSGSCEFGVKMVLWAWVSSGIIVLTVEQTVSIVTVLVCLAHAIVVTTRVVHVDIGIDHNGHQCQCYNRLQHVFNFTVCDRTR